MSTHIHTHTHTKVFSNYSHQEKKLNIAKTQPVTKSTRERLIP